MKIITEKVIKTDRVRKRFSDVVNSLYGGYEDKALQKANRLIKKDSNLKYEVKPHLQDIMKYVGDMSIVLELECYLTVAETFESDKSPTLILKDVTGDNIFEIFRRYFKCYENDSACDNLDSAYHNYITDSLKEQGKENITDLMIERAKYDTTIKDYISETFSNLAELVKTFNFINPIYGWKNGDKKTGAIYEEPRDREVYSNKKERMQDIADAISENLYIEKDRIIVSVNPVYNKDPDNWYVETDGSLNDNGDYLAVEIVTADLPIRGAISMVKRFREKIFDEFDGRTDETVGAHINIRLPENSPIDILKAVVLTNDPLWADQFDRVDNRWAKSQYFRIKRACKELEDGLTINEVIDRVKGKVSVDKYNSTNFGKDNMLEFRFPGNDYLGNNKLFEDYLETIRWCVFMSVLAIHPNLFRQEFQSKLMKLYSKTRKPVEASDMDTRLKQWKSDKKSGIKTRNIKRKPIPV